MHVFSSSSYHFVIKFKLVLSIKLLSKFLYFLFAATSQTPSPALLNKGFSFIPLACRGAILNDHKTIASIIICQNVIWVFPCRLLLKMLCNWKEKSNFQFIIYTKNYNNIGTFIVWFFPYTSISQKCNHWCFFKMSHLSDIYRINWNIYVGRSKESFGYSVKYLDR